MRCPICHKPVADDDPEFPFYSQRCRTIDLGNWASGVYRVPVKPEEPDSAPGEAPTPRVPPQGSQH